YEEARRILAAALAQEPAHEKARRAMGRLLLSEGHPREALPYLEDAAQSKDPDPLLDLAAAYLALSDSERAAEAAARVLDGNPRPSSCPHPARTRPRDAGTTRRGRRLPRACARHRPAAG